MFTHDTEDTLPSAAALVNTGLQGEELGTPEDLEHFLRTWEFSGNLVCEASDVRAVHRLRTRLHALWAASPEELVEDVNDLLRTGRALPQLVRHDGWDWHIHATPHGAPVATRLGVEIAMALTDLIRGGETDRMGLCEAEGCDGVLVDFSRNRSRRFCSTTCGNRVAAAAYRARRKHADAAE